MHVDDNDDDDDDDVLDVFSRTHVFSRIFPITKYYVIIVLVFLKCSKLRKIYIFSFSGMHVDDDDDDDDDDDLDNLTSFPEPLGQAHDMFFHEFSDYNSLTVYLLLYKVHFTDLLKDSNT